MAKEIYLLIGAPCSGKTTWSKEFLKTNSNFLRTSRDEIRTMLTGKLVNNKEIEQLVTDMVYTIIEYASELDLSVIIDQTNCDFDGIIDFHNRYKFEFDFKFMVFNQPLEVLIERNMNRSVEINYPPMSNVEIEKIKNKQNALLQLKEFKELVDGSMVWI